MSDFIRRNDVIKAIHGYWGNKINELPTENTEDGEVIADVRKANEYLEHNKQLSLFVQLIEAVEVAEPKRGRWIKYVSPIPEEDDGVEAWDCSECSAMVNYPTNYCPKCGARMERMNEYL